jgi:cyclic pyranopterin phosphate synthase
VRVSPTLARAIRENTLAKGDVLGVARLAGIQAAKRTDELIPLCHSLPVDHADVRATLEDGAVRLRSEVRTHARTGVEMEALVAAAAASLALYDMCKAVDRGMTIEAVRLVEKRGGKSGHWRRPGEPTPSE